MSRIGRKPIPIPKGVTTQLDGTRITVKGPKGEISRLIHAELAVAVEGETIVVRRPSDESRHKALHGLTRALRSPEPYKGKGIRYVGEQVRRKAGKTAQAAK